MLKSTALGIVFAFMTFIYAGAQTQIVFTPDKVNCQTIKKDTAIVEILTMIKNTSTSTLQMRWVLLQDDFKATGVEYSFCDPIQCYFGMPDSADFSIDSNQNSTFKLDIFLNSMPIKGTLRVKLFDINESKKVDTMIFCMDATSLGISENNNLVQFNIYPNPALDLLNIQTQERIKEAIIYNSLGEKVSEASSIGLGNIQMNVSSLKPGVYYIIVKNSNNEAGIKPFVIGGKF